MSVEEGLVRAIGALDLEWSGSCGATVFEFFFKSVVLVVFVFFFNSSLFDC